MITVTALLLSVSSLFSEEQKSISEKVKVSKAFLRLMNTAQPVPLNIKQIKKGNIPLAEQATSPLFLNVSTIDDEADISNTQKMQNESSIAINPQNSDNLIAAAVDYRANNSRWVYVSKDAGKSWKNVNLGKVNDDWSSSNDPSVAFDIDGTGYLVYGAFGDRLSGVTAGENGVYIAKTTDGGDTWKSHIPVIEHSGEMTLDSLFEDKYYITVDNSDASPYCRHLYIPWKRVTPVDSATQIVMSKSTDKGETWSAPVNISDRLTGTSEDTTYGQSFPLAACGPDGDVYVVWNNGIEHGVGFAKSTDGGATFTEPRIIQYYDIFGTTKFLKNQDGYRHCLKGIVRAEAYPVLVTDFTHTARRGNLYLSWAADSVPNIYFSRSTDKGETWSEPVIVHSDQTNDQFWQWLCLDPQNGSLAIMYLDSRNDPDNIMVECYASYSSDGGETWVDRRVSDINSDLRLNPFGNEFAGDYNGCAMYKGIIYPSWVDMRTAVENIYDSEVYTAVVNTLAPAAPENFEAVIVPEDPNRIELQWEHCGEMAFGHPLEKGDYFYGLSRDGELLAWLEADVFNYTDEGLEAHQEYEYSIFAVRGVAVTHIHDSSMTLYASAFAGGAENPSAPEIVYAEGRENNDVVLSIQMPLTREDSITALANLDKVLIYRDGELIKEETVNASDTGIVLQFTEENAQRGFYTYSAKVADNEATAHISNMSNEVIVYTGPVNINDGYNFDGEAQKYNISGPWAATSAFYNSGPNSFTDSPDGDYEKLTTSTFGIFPVKIPGGMNSVLLSFNHAVIVDKTDEAAVEYSTDRGDTWSKAATYNMLDYEYWEDGVLDNNDWKPETITIESAAGDTVYIRFTLETNVLKHADGWYVDDINIQTANDVKEEYRQLTENIEVYPNPASESIYIDFNTDLNNSAIRIYDLYGRQVNNFKSASYMGQTRVDISELISGTYIIELNTANGMKIRKKFCKSR